MQSVQRQGNTKPAPSRISSLAWPIAVHPSGSRATLRRVAKALKTSWFLAKKGFFLIHNGNQQNAYRCMMVYENIQDYTSK
jgi:hypothetical protein